jgi:hypothetical protein
MEVDFKTDATFTIIKGRFKAPASSSFGLFIILMDNVTKNVDRYDIIASHFSTVYENSINMPWNEMEDLIAKMKWKGEFATNLTHDIQATFEDLFEPGTGRGIDIWHAIKKSQINKACAIIEEYLMRPTGDKNIKIEIGVETINSGDLEEVKKARQSTSGQQGVGEAIAAVTTQDDNLNLGDSAVVLDVSLVLAPINGISLLELTEGDKILVKISEETSRGQYFIDLLDASRDHEVIPIPASVVKVTAEGKYYTLLVNIGPGVYGKSIQEDNLKVKKYDPARDTRKPKTAKMELMKMQSQMDAAADPTMLNPQDAKTKKEPNLVLFLAIGGFALLVLLILIILFS